VPASLASEDFFCAGFLEKKPKTMMISERETIAIEQNSECSGGLALSSSSHACYTRWSRCHNAPSINIVAASRNTHFPTRIRVLFEGLIICEHDIPGWLDLRDWKF
jgi:hypothetical protein